MIAQVWQLHRAATWRSRSGPPALASSRPQCAKASHRGRQASKPAIFSKTGLASGQRRGGAHPCRTNSNLRASSAIAGRGPPSWLALPPFPPPQRADVEDMDALSGHSLTQASQGDSTARSPAIKVWVASPRKPHGQTLFPKTSGPLCDLRSPLEFRPPRLRLTSTYIRTGLTPVRGLGLRSLSLTWSPEGKHR